MLGNYWMSWEAAAQEDPSLSAVASLSPQDVWMSSLQLAPPEPMAQSSQYLPDEKSLSSEIGIYVERLSKDHPETSLECKAEGWTQGALIKLARAEVGDSSQQGALLGVDQLALKKMFKCGTLLMSPIPQWGQVQLKTALRKTIGATCWQVVSRSEPGTDGPGGLLHTSSQSSLPLSQCCGLTGSPRLPAWTEPWECGAL